ncbi:MAG: ABC transporter ATP-binding protein [Alphaproteobacteria bacterium]|nr:ABC transporter ATP-binding protein [Alphaproteobacteria bacterium]
MSIRISGLTLHYAGVATPAVVDVDLEVATGELVTLLGPSGSGKSTTLRCVAGLERPTRGTIAIQGDVVCDMSRRGWVKPEHRQLGMVFQSYAVWPHLSVFDNIAYPLRIRRLDKSRMREKVEAVAELVALSAFLGRSATQLSGGQQQRVALARALVAEPRAILFDEPLSNLDAKLRERMRREIKALVRKTGLTALYVTHDQAEAFAISDRIAVMDTGRISQVGAPREIYRQPSSRYVADFVGAANIVAGIVTSGLFRAGDLGLELPVTAGDGAAEAAIRPEQITLSTAPAPGSRAAQEIDREYLGGYAMLNLRLGETELRVHVAADDVPDAGTPIWITIPASAPVFLGPATSPASQA